MKSLPRFFMVEDKLVKMMRVDNKITGQVISTGLELPAATVLSKGTEISEKEFIKEKAKLLKSHKL